MAPPAEALPFEQLRLSLAQGLEMGLPEDQRMGQRAIGDPEPRRCRVPQA